VRDFPPKVAYRNVITCIGSGKVRTRREMMSANFVAEFACRLSINFAVYTRNPPPSAAVLRVDQ